MRKKINLLAIIILFISPCLFAQPDDFKVQSFNVSKGGKLEINLSAGDINITTWNKDEVNVKYENDFDEGEIKIEKNNNNIEIRSVSNSYTDELYLSVPSQFNFSLSTKAGDIKINGKIIGKVEGKTSGGDIAFDDVEGNLELRTGGGDIKTSNVKGNIAVNSHGGDLLFGNISGKAEIKTAGGNIQIENIQQDAEIKTAGGNISVKNIGGNSTISSGGGNIDAGIISGNAELKTGGGNIELKSAKGKVEVKSGAGNIDLQNVAGSVNVFTGAGEINLKLIPDDKSKSEIKSSSGNIFLYISENSKATIEAKSTYYSSGNWSSDDQSDIISDFNPSENKNSNGKNYKTFILNGGGSSINLQTSYGSIEIRKIKK